MDKTKPKVTSDIAVDIVTNETIVRNEPNSSGKTTRSSSKKRSTPPLPVELIRPPVDPYHEELIIGLWFDCFPKCLCTDSNQQKKRAQVKCT